MTDQDMGRPNDPRAMRLKQAMADLPFVAGDLSGIGGQIKAEPEHFQVEELLPYSPCGEGEHVYLTLRRKGWNTADVGAALAKRFKIPINDIGWGGRKDRQAVCTQTFSIPLPLTEPMETIITGLNDLPFEVLKGMRHRNKIKTGHVAANRFKILLSQVPSDCLGQAEAIAEALRHRGIPNFYGEQRFGIQMNNLDAAVRQLRHPKSARGAKGTFMVSVLQSALFNLWLAARMNRKEYNTLIQGDLVQKTDTGGLFIVEDLEEASVRFHQRAVVYTGPIFGHKMKAPADAAGQWENQVLADWDLDVALFKSLRAPGSRRPAILWLADLTIDPVAEGLLFGFTLPAGAYATTVMREFMRPV